MSPPVPHRARPLKVQGLPDMNGIGATTRLVQGGSRARILVLTTFDLDEYMTASSELRVNPVGASPEPPDKP